MFYWVQNLFTNVIAILSSDLVSNLHLLDFAPYESKFIIYWMV